MYTSFFFSSYSPLSLPAKKKLNIMEIIHYLPFLIVLNSFSSVVDFDLFLRI